MRNLQLIRSIREEEEEENCKSVCDERAELERYFLSFSVHFRFPSSSSSSFVDEHIFFVKIMTHRNKKEEGV